jgi:hypothetical protein
MIETTILAPIVRVQTQQQQTRTGGGVSLTTGYLLETLRGESQ